jgi:hypothetical protein
MGQGYGRLFVAAQSRVAGQAPGALLGHVDSFEDAETPLDNVVDQTEQAAVVDRLGLEAYQRRKPGRFARLKLLSESPPMPPAVIAYYEGNLDPQTVTRLRVELTQAHEQSKRHTSSGRSVESSGPRPGAAPAGAVPAPSAAVPRRHRGTW